MLHKSISVEGQVVIYGQTFDSHTIHILSKLHEQGSHTILSAFVLRYSLVQIITNALPLSHTSIFEDRIEVTITATTKITAATQLHRGVSKNNLPPQR